METFEYRSKKIDYEESANPKLSFDGEPVDVSLDVDAGEYIAGELPFHTFTSVRKLAEAVADYRISNE